MALVVDTSVLLGALDAADDAHPRCAALLSETQEEVIIPAPALVELDHLLDARGKLDAWVSFCVALAQNDYSVAPLDVDMILGCARLQAKYTDLRLGFVDAAVFLTCVDLGETKVATLDRRHFSVLRTDDGRALQIVPEPD